MGHMVQLTASDGFVTQAYVAEPSGTPRGAMVVVQEIFGLNHHVKAVADAYAAQGYLSIAPSFFDRVLPGIDLGYSPQDIEVARGHMGKVDMDKVMLDVAAAVAHVKGAGKVGMVGYCWGGRVCWISAANVAGVSATVSYYGGGVPGLADLSAQCPTMFHWGELDHAIPLDTVEAFIAKHPEAAATSFVYMGAQHGFNCDERGSWNADAAKLASSRTIEFLHKHVG